ncbi:MAG TPA: Type 1 glutamine amidotransferase-like domain-containing protein [Acidimicrobiales bacterium]|nr:Type 1 glutamine amidotransferase-like domain-containing protein [Acidimicrobiales bacterium]
MSGPLALVGGQAWSDGCEFDKDLLAASGATEVVVLPTAAAYESPATRVAAAETWFSGLGAEVRSLSVLARPDAFEQEHVDAIAAARFVYLSGGSPLHLRSVLKETPAWEALCQAWESGAVIAGSSAGAMVLTDPMVDPRGGAFTLGLGLLPQLALICHYEDWSVDKAHRTISLAPKGMPVLGVPNRTAAIRDGEGGWRVAGAGQVKVFVDGAEASLDVLP